MLDVFEGPSTSSTQVQDIHCNYVLIDGSKRGDAERWLYELVDTPDYRNLFDGMEWASIREVAPLLVRTEPSHPLLGPLSEEGKTLEWGYGIASDESLDLVANHLRRFITVSHPLGHDVMLRFADPTVARVLLAPSGDGGVSEFWAPFTAVRLPDALWDGWHIQTRPESWIRDAGNGVPGNPTLSLGELTLSCLAESDRRAMLVRLMQHLETYFPDRIASKVRQDVVTDLLTITEQATSNGYDSFQALSHWCTVYGCMGELAQWGVLAPDVYDIFCRRPGQAAEAQAREAAVAAMAWAETQVQGEPIHG